MNREDFDLACEHINDSEVTALASHFTIELAAQLGISPEQAAGLSITALTKKFFPGYDTNRSLTMIIEVNMGEQVTSSTEAVMDSRGVPLELQNESILLKIPGTVTPFDNPLDAILYSGRED